MSRECRHISVNVHPRRSERGGLDDRNASEVEASPGWDQPRPAVEREQDEQTEREIIRPDHPDDELRVDEAGRPARRHERYELRGVDPCNQCVDEEEESETQAEEEYGLGGAFARAGRCPGEVSARRTRRRP